VIESVSFKGPSATIKSHHNVGGLPERMHMKLIEPLRELFKDEVRRLGRELGLSESRVQRQPFPGPGLAVRILGPVDADAVHLLGDADAIVDTEIRAAGLYQSLWQSFAVLLPVKSVGVMGDDRTYERACVIRAVQSLDGMTANVASCRGRCSTGSARGSSTRCEGSTASATTSRRSRPRRSSGSEHLHRRATAGHAPRRPSSSSARWPPQRSPVPFPWSACVLAGTMTVAALVLRNEWAPLALAVGAAPWWLSALGGRGGAVLALVLAAAAIVGSGSLRIAAVLAAAALFEGMRLHVLEDRGLVAQTEGPFLIVGGLAVAALVRGTGRASFASYAAVVGAALLGGVPVARALMSPPTDADDVVREARLETLGADEAALVARPALGLRALSVRPSWHDLAEALVPEVGLERVLSAGWLPEKAPLDPLPRITPRVGSSGTGVAGRGSGCWRATRRRTVRWWLALFRRARGWETDDAKLVVAPRGVASLPGWIELEARNPVEVVFHADAPLRELAIERRERPFRSSAAADPEQAELFAHNRFGEGLQRTGAPLVVLQVDGVEHAAELVDRGTVRLPMTLPAGPHRVWIWSEQPAIVGRLGAF
jgi:hypothetical protein